MSGADDGGANARLLARIEALEAAKEGKKEPLPFWRNTALVGFIGASLAAVPPLLTAIHEYYQTEREVRLSLVKYQHERTISYLDRALNPETKEAKQAQVFRFLRHLPEDDPIHRWATEELGRVEGTIEQLKAQVEVRKQELAQQQDAIDEELEQIEVALADSDTTEAAPLLQVAQLSLAEKSLEADNSRKQISELEVRAGLAPEQEKDLPIAAPNISLRPRLWKIRIALVNDLTSARSAANKARSRGAQPEIRRQDDQFWVLVGAYGTHVQALDAREEARAYLKGPVAVIDVAKWCSSGRMKEDYFDCDPAVFDRG